MAADLMVSESLRAWGRHREMKMETPAVALLEPKPGKTAKSVYDHSWWILDADVSSHFRTIGMSHVCCRSYRI